MAEGGAEGIMRKMEEGIKKIRSRNSSRNRQDATGHAEGGEEIEVEPAQDEAGHLEPEIIVRCTEDNNDVQGVGAQGGGPLHRTRYTPSVDDLTAMRVAENDGLGRVLMHIMRTQHELIEHLNLDHTGLNVGRACQDYLNYAKDHDIQIGRAHV